MKPDDLPSDLVSARAALRTEREARLQAEAVAASVQAQLSDNEALIAHLGPIAAETSRLLTDPAALDAALRLGAERAEAIATPILKRTKEIVGFLPRH